MPSDPFDHPVPLPREHRLRPCIAYGGKLSNVRRAHPPCLAAAGRSFSQGSICLLLPALGTLASLPETAVLLHGAVGCGSSCHAVTGNVRSQGAARSGETKDALWLTTAMNEIDVIAGGEEKLARAIEEVDQRYAPKVILVVITCAPGVTGDDVEAVTAQAAERVRAKVVPVHCEGFKTKIWATAYDAYYHAFGRHLFEPPPGAPPVDEERAKRTVNLLNVSSMGRTDELELIRLLTALDLEVNVFPVFSRPEEMYRVTRAALTVSTCPTHDDYLVAHLEDRYGIPYVLRHMPIGIESTGRWLRDIAQWFGPATEAKAEELIAREENALREALSPLLPLFAKKRVFLSAGEFRALATANLLCELGFELAAVRPFHHDEFAEVEYRKLETRAAGAVVNIANAQPFEEANLLTRLRPDLFLGHLVGNSTASKLGIPTHTIYHVGLPYLGYRGAFEVARRLARHLRNPAFHRGLAEHVRLPYSKWWLHSDPFRYIREGAFPDLSTPDHNNPSGIFTMPKEAEG